MEGELKKAKIRRGAIKRSLSRAVAFLDSEDVSTVNVTHIRQRKEKIDATWKEFDEVQTTIDLISEETTEADNERKLFEDKYFEIVSRFEEIIAIRTINENGAPMREQVQMDRHVRDAIHTNSYVRLPKIELPTFSGGYEDWYPFHDTFVSLIHSQTHISNIQKFHYLRSALRGEAAELTHSLEISADNYKEAWQLLSQRYDNKRLIIQKHIKALFELPMVIKENHVSLRALLDGVSKHKRALKALGRSTEQWDDLIVHLITSKLDVTANKEWENSLIGSDIPTLQDLINFLEHRCHTLEIIQRKVQPSLPGASKHSSARPTSSNIATQSSGKGCPICKENHFVFACKTFLNMSVTDRAKAVRDSKLCLNCLRSISHRAKDCMSRSCKNCDKRHNTLLHFPTATKSNAESSKESKQQEATSLVPTITSMVHESEHSQVWLSTVKLQVLDNEGRPHTCRALLDPGSQSNLITEALVNKLSLPRLSNNISIVGVNQVMSLARELVKVTLTSRHYSYKREVECLVLKHITNKVPAMPFNKAKMNIPQNLKLADPSFHLPGDVDMLISATIFWESLCVGQIEATEDHPVIQKTLFGWVLGGSAQASRQNQAPSICNLITNQQLNESLIRFWNAEHIPERTNYTNEEKLCEEHFKQNYHRDIEGRFIVQLPFKEGFAEQLGDSRFIALRRFYSLERKLRKDAKLKRQYTDFLEEYQRLKHMEKISDESSQPGYYLPHHPVVKEDSLTTRVRVVFDASLKTSTGVSLNDTLMVGPTLQQDLWDIILRFRMWLYVISADVEKMYRQVRIHNSQTKYQRIFWRNDPNEKIETFELKTVTYGTAPASYLATRVLQEAAHIERLNFPTGAETILSDFYVDDLLTGADKLDEIIKIRDEVIALLSKIGFKLRKWISNSSESLQGISDSESPDQVLILNKEEQYKTLGLQWHASLDTLQYDVKMYTISGSVTKRKILASIARIFDPLGLLGPVVITGKILMQKLWILKIDWDETVPLEIETKWRTYESQLSLLDTLRIPRRVVAYSETKAIELHGFCDASLEAYGAALYIKSSSTHGKQKTHLLCAKSRVAPAKTITVPRLELCAAYLLAQLTYKVSQVLRVKLNGIYHWTDSMIVLGWIRSEANRWNTFVSNRIGQIQEWTDVSSWRHVDTKENPADIISRGIAPSQLIHSPLWWHGPPWLNHEALDWKASIFTLPDIGELPEMRKSILTITHASEEWDIFSRISSATRLIRVTAYVLRFLNNSKTTKQERHKGPLTASDLNQATIRLVRIIQGYYFATDFKALQKGELLPRSSKLVGLSPFIDESGVIRVGGRLSQSRLPYSTKHPIVLPSNHKFTTMLIVREHQNLLHAGPQSTLASLRQLYWPISGRSAVRKVTRNCIRCFKAMPSGRPMPMGDLPSQRVSPSRPFLHCGIDYCGPFMVKESRTRNSKSFKSYVSIFICLSSKAIHLELVSDLSTEAFLNALKRFISRRGIPSDIYTDNGTNFVGAERELKELRKASIKAINQDSVADFSAQRGISWHFIPPHAPHFGGLWEAAVKAMKFHLKRVAGAACLRHDELLTVLAQIEAVLNSRPIIPLSNDPNDHTYLSPAHFLIGDTFTVPPEPVLLDVKENRLSRWQRVEQLKQHFWRRWLVDYLNQLQQRTKWKFHASSLKLGDLVIVREDNIPPLCWSMGRVEAVHPGADGIVRVATVKTAKGSYKRPTTRLCPLPSDIDNSIEL